MNLSSQFDGVLYHGTSHWFKPGETVDPTPDRVYGGEAKAFATTSKDTAGNFAHGTTVRGLKRKGGQGTLFAPIFEVEPSDDLQKSMPAPNDTAYHTRKGFKVKGLAGYRNTSDMDEDRLYHDPIPQDKRLL